MTDNWLERTELLLGAEKLEKLRAAHVLVVGLGGVGAYAAEMIARAGVGRMTVADADTVNPTNINRQLVALHSTVGRQKAEVLAERLRDINPAIELTVVNRYIKDEETYTLLDAARYDFTLREEQTHEIIEDVAHMKSELGILYLSEHNREVIERMLVANELVFEGLFCATPHVFVCADHPLADRSSVTLEDLEDYPFLSYEQGSYNSFYYSEELTSTFERRKNIRVRDRATLFNLAMGLNGYTVCSGVISHELNGPGIISIPLDVDEYMEIGIITRKNTTLTRYGRAYIDAIRQHI